MHKKNIIIIISIVIVIKVLLLFFQNDNRGSFAVGDILYTLFIVALLLFGLYQVMRKK